MLYYQVLYLLKYVSQLKRMVIAHMRKSQHAHLLYPHLLPFHIEQGKTQHIGAGVNTKYAPDGGFINSVQMCIAFMNKDKHLFGFF